MSASIPEITVITATFNAGRVLRDLVASLRAQSDRSFEWIVIDGASSDDTLDVLRDAGDVVSYWESVPDFGIYDALNKAVRRVRTDYYLVVGADDRLDANAISNYRMAASESGADIITAPVRIGAEIVRWKDGPAWLYGQAAYISSHAVGAIFRKELHNRYGYYSCRFPIAADQLFVKRACKGGASLFRADFVAGEYGTEGASGADIAGALSEMFRVQLETESRFVQVVLYVLRLIKNYSRL